MEWRSERRDWSGCRVGAVLCWESERGGGSCCEGSKSCEDVVGREVGKRLRMPAVTARGISTAAEEEGKWEGRAYV